MKWIKEIINWFSELFFIVRNYRSKTLFLTSQIEGLERELRQLEQIIQERTQMDVDISPHFKDPHNIILTGRYNGRDYVEIFSVRTEDLYELVQMLQQMERYAKINKINTGPYDSHMRRVIEDELNLD